MTREEFAEYLGVSTRTLDRLLRRREVGCVRLGGRVLFMQKHADELLTRSEKPRLADRRNFKIVNG